MYILLLWVRGFSEVLLRTIIAFLGYKALFLFIRVKTDTINTILAHLYHRYSLEIYT